MIVFIEERTFSVKVKLGKPFLNNDGHAQREMDMRTPYGTLREFLAEMSKIYKYAGRFPLNILNIKSKEINSDFGISVNGVENELLPERLETTLREGDELEISMIMLGGG